jgi:hypothetical protein
MLVAITTEAFDYSPLTDLRVGFGLIISKVLVAPLISASKFQLF